MNRLGSRIRETKRTDGTRQIRPVSNIEGKLAPEQPYPGILIAGEELHSSRWLATETLKFYALVIYHRP